MSPPLAPRSLFLSSCPLPLLPPQLPLSVCSELDSSGGLWGRERTCLCCPFPPGASQPTGRGWDCVPALLCDQARGPQPGLPDHPPFPAVPVPSHSPSLLPDHSPEPLKCAILIPCWHFRSSFSVFPPTADHVSPFVHVSLSGLPVFWGRDFSSNSAWFSPVRCSCVDLSSPREGPWVSPWGCGPAEALQAQVQIAEGKLPEGTTVCCRMVPAEPAHWVSRDWVHRAACARRESTVPPAPRWCRCSGWGLCLISDCI